jgi:hypothetical protein
VCESFTYILTDFVLLNKALTSVRRDHSEDMDVDGSIMLNGS